MLAKNLEEELEGADLFALVPPTEDCAICFLPLSRVPSNSGYRACCGKVICLGCSGESHVLVKRQNAVIKKQNEKNADKKDKKEIVHICPFCREIPALSDKEYIQQLEARALKNDHVALRNLGSYFAEGSYGLCKDDLKALDCFIKAVELGSPYACTSIGLCYSRGCSVSKDMERKALFYRVGALRGCIYARNNIGKSEYDSGNQETGIRHWKVAAEAGSQLSLNELKGIYNADGKLPGKEFITKECMDSLYRVCHDAQEEVKSEEREKHGHDAYNMKC